MFKKKNSIKDQVPAPGFYPVGDVVRVNRSFLGEPAGVLAYVYEHYSLSTSLADMLGNNGVSIITENGMDLGGFSPDEQAEFLEPVGKTGFVYEHRNAFQLSQDFETSIKPLFKNFQ